MSAHGVPMTFYDRRVLRIGSWRVDPTTDEISRGAETHKLEPRTMRLLLYLAAHPGQVVDVRRLLDEVWAGVIVTPGSVYQAIAQLRRLLGDQAEHPTYIDTHSRKGYRLVASVSPWAPPERDDQPLGGADSPAMHPSSPRDAPGVSSGRRLLAAGLVGAAVVALGLARIFTDGHSTTPLVSRTASFSPPPHSVAVLPFVNISGDKEQEYFSDGLTEELLNSLSRISDLRVAARTSSFYFKGKDVDLPTVAHKLNVASVLEGSVRRSGNKIRITAQLNNAVTGFHLWSQTYDRDLSDVLEVQTDIANAVANGLKVTLLDDIATRIEIGGTRNPAAFDAYLRASKTYREYRTKDELEAATAQYTEAIRLDPDYAMAHVARSIAHLEFVTYWASGPDTRDHLNKAQADARTAITIAPDLAEGHLALAIFFTTSLDFRRANDEFERALALDAGSARVLQSYGRFAVNMGHTEAGVAALRRAVALDSLDVSYHASLIVALRLARHYNESLAAYQEFLSFFPDIPEAQLIGTTLYYSLGDPPKVRSLCNSKLKNVLDEHPGAEARAILAVCRYPKVSRDADAETALKEFTASQGDDGAYDYAKMYTQWGDTAKALQWLETALRHRAVALQELKVEPLLDPLRKEARFQAIERELRFPN